MFKSFTSNQEVPFQFSVSPVELPVSPPNPNAEVLSAPVPPISYLAVFKLFTSVQFVPFQLSVSFLIEAGGKDIPPKYNAEVDVPDAPPPYLAVFKSLTSVQFVPFHNSVITLAGGPNPIPAIAKAAA